MDMDTLDETHPYFGDDGLFDTATMHYIDFTEVNLDPLDIYPDITELSNPFTDLNQDMIDLVTTSINSPYTPVPFDNIEAFDMLFPNASDEEQSQTGHSELTQLLLTKSNSNTNTSSKNTQSNESNRIRQTEEPERVSNGKNLKNGKNTTNQSSSHNVMTRLLTSDKIKSNEPLGEMTNQKHKGKEVEKTVSKALKFPPCFICGGNASGLHYGINSCEACKGFFRRYIIRDEEYKCMKGGNCKIVNKNRENCSGCRLQKCFSLGMSKNRSKLGRYTLSRRTETIKQVNKLEGKSNSQPNKMNGTKNNKGVVTGSRDLGDATSDLNIYIAGLEAANCDESVISLVKAMQEIQPYGKAILSDAQVQWALHYHHERYMNKIETYGQMKSVPKEEYYKLLKYGIDIDGRIKILKEYVREIERVTVRYCNFAKSIPGFTDLPRNDQSSLLKASRCDFFLLLMHEGYNDEHKIILTRNGVAYHIEEIADKCFSRDLINSICKTYSRWQKLCLTKSEKALLIALLLFFTDRCKLERGNAAEKIQIRLALLLREELERADASSAVRRFGKMIDMLTLMRESSEQYSKEYKQLCKDEVVREEIPMMKKFAVDD